jgi:hypothetical protein
MPSTETQKLSLACFTCKRIYDTKSKLERHRTDKCECRGLFVCPGCPVDKAKKFARPERLREHFSKHHNPCGQHCEAKHNMLCPSHLASLEKSTLYEPHPPKQAWGCPICESCFETRGAWREHEKTHYGDVNITGGQTTDFSVRGWSRVTRVRALLFSKQLRYAASHYDWRKCSWDLSPEDYESLTFTLERLTLPTQLSNHRQYAGLAPEVALVEYALRMDLSLGNATKISKLDTYQRRPMRILRSSSSSTPTSMPMSLPNRSVANGAQYPQNHGSTTSQPFQNRENEAAFKFPVPPSMSNAPATSAIAPDFNTLPEEQIQAARGTLQDSDRPRSRGSSKASTVRARSASSASRQPAQAFLDSSAPPLPELPPASYTGSDQDITSWLNLEAGSSNDLHVYGSGLSTQTSMANPEYQSSYPPYPQGNSPARTRANSTTPAAQGHQPTGQFQEPVSSRMSWRAGTDVPPGLFNHLQFEIQGNWTPGYHNYQNYQGSGM